MDALTCSAVCSVLATAGEPLHRATLECWIRAGVVRPARRDSDRDRLYRACDVLALIVARGLRDNSVGLDVASAVGSWIRRQSIDGLQRAVDAGRTHLCIVDGACAPDLMRATIRNALAARKEAIRSSGISAILIDVGAAFQRLQAAMMKEKLPV